MKENVADLEIRVNGVMLVGLGRERVVQRNGMGSYPLNRYGGALVLRPGYDSVSDPYIVFLGPANGLPANYDKLYELLQKLNHATRHQGRNPLKNEDILVPYEVNERGDGRIVLPTTLEFEGFHFKQIKGTLLFMPCYDKPKWGWDKVADTPLPTR